MRRSYGQLALGPDWQRLSRATKTQGEADYRPAGRTAASGYEGLTGHSAMIYLDVPNELIHSVPGGVDDHHITVVYLGKDVTEDAFSAACERARLAAAAHHPVYGLLNGTGSFPPDADSGKIPVFVPAYVPGIGELRRELEDLSASEHKDYRPHVTLAFLAAGEPMPPPHPPVKVGFTHLHARRGDRVLRFPLGGP